MSFEQLDALRHDAAAITSRKQVARDPKMSLQIVQEICARALAHPLFDRYRVHLQSSASVHNTEPWHAIGERLYATALVSMILTHPDETHVYGAPGKTPAERLLTAAILMARLERATPYLWSTKIMTEVGGSPDLPQHVFGKEALPYPIMFWSWEVAGIAVEEPWSGLQTNWMLVCHEGDGVSVAFDMQGKPDDRNINFLVINLKYGTIWPDDIPPEARTGVSIFLKRLAFLNSPYIDVKLEHLSRPMRREMHRTLVKAGAQPISDLVDPSIYTVTLRQAPAAPSGKRTLSERTWRHHWWVRGHYRSQWYPSGKSHQVIWVPPYMKGDRSMPLLEKTYIVER